MKPVLTATLIYVFSFVSISLCAQTPFIKWEKSVGGSKDDTPTSIIPTSDGGYIVAGYSFSNDGMVSILDADTGSFIINGWVVKLDSLGSVKWKNVYGGSRNDYIFDIQQTSDGEYIMCGATNSADGDITSNAGSDDIWIIKADTAGTIVWQKTYGGLQKDEAQSIRETQDGGFIIAGYSSSNNGDLHSNNGNADLFLLKINNVGDMEWIKSYGGSDYDLAASVEQTIDNGFIVSGYSKSSNGDVSTNLGDEDFWVVKVDPSGNLEWEKSLGGSNQDRSLGIKQTTDGGYITIGYTLSGDGDVNSHHDTSRYDGWIVKLDGSGAIEWQRTMGGTNPDLILNVDITNDGGYIVSGGTSSTDGDVTGYSGGFFSDVWIAKLNASGTLEWNKCLGGTGYDVATSIKQTPDGGYILAGASTSNDGHASYNYGLYDFWIVKLDTGTYNPLQAPFQLSASLLHSPLSVKLTWVDNNPNAAGFRVQKSVDGVIFDQIAVIPSQTTTYNDLDIVANTTYYYRVSAYDPNDSSAFSNVAQIHTNLGMTSNANIAAISIYPNPAQSAFTVTNIPTNATIKISDLTGKTVLAFNTLNSTETVNINQWSKGVYFVQIKYKDAIITTQKLMVNK